MVVFPYIGTMEKLKFQFSLSYSTPYFEMFTSSFSPSVLTRNLNVS